MGWKGSRVFEQTLLEVQASLRLECSTFFYPSSIPSYPETRPFLSSRDTRVLPLFSACPSLPLSRPISRTLMWISCLSRVLPFLILFRGKGVQVACIKFERCFVLVPEKRDTMQLRLNEGTMVNYFEEGLVSRVCLDREEFLTVQILGRFLIF